MNRVSVESWWKSTIFLLVLLLPACGRHTPSVGSTSTETKSRSGIFEYGIASWYGPGFHGKLTANGETYNMYAMTAAHKELPFDTWLRVDNLDNGRSTIVRINDRGPFIEGRIIDLSLSAAEDIGMVGPGTAQVDLYILDKNSSKKIYSRSNRTLAFQTKKQSFVVQIGSFRSKAEALRLKARLALQFPDVSISETSLSGETMFRIRMGSFGSRQGASEFRELLLKEGVVEQAIVMHSGS